MRGILEIIQDLPPVAVFLGTAAMALVYDDQVKEIPGKLFVHIGSLVRA